MLGLAAALTLSLSSVHVAFATRFPGVCPHGGNPVSGGCLNNGTQMIAIFGTWKNQTTVCSGCSHINNEMWGYTNGDETRWVEIGLRNGFDAANPCYCQAYEVFWSDYDPTTQTEYRHWIANTVPNGSTHYYEVQHQCFGCNNWNVYYDYNYVGYSAMQTSDVVYDHEAGLEDPNVNPSTHADTFDNYMQYEGTDGNWYYWPGLYAWVDYGCGSYPNGYCMNGASSAPMSGRITSLSRNVSRRNNDAKTRSAWWVTSLRRARGCSTRYFQARCRCWQC